VRVEGHIELDWALEAIRVGARARRELGDIDALVASIDANGFFQPMTIAPDGLLILGWRRYEAARRLGLRTVNVWVRSGLSNRLQLLLAEQDDDALHKPLTATENATLYQEIKQVMAEEAARRQEQTRFGAVATGEDDGAAKLAAPSDRTARARAAQMVTGTNSYTTLERIGEVQRIAEDPTLPESLRTLAIDALAGMDEDGKVNGRYQVVKDAAAAARQEQLSRMATDALARVSGERKQSHSPHHSPASVPPATRQYSVRAFVVTWTEMADWSTHYDPAVIGPALTAEQWESFQQTVTETTTFTDAARAARSTPTEHEAEG
jgi:ParB family chromosome partitioning protein